MEFNLDAGAFLQEDKVLPFDPDSVYDVMIIGGGPAGLTSAVYCMRKGLSTGIIIGEIGGKL